MVLAAFERGMKALGVRADFALADDGLLNRVNHLDRIFDGDDVNAPFGVEQVHQGRQRRGLAGTIRPRDDNQTLMVVEDLTQLLGQSKALEGGRLGHDESEGALQAGALRSDVHSQATHALHLAGEVRIAQLQKLSRIPLVQEWHEHRPDFGVGDGCALGAEPTEAAQAGRLIGHDVHIARGLLIRAHEHLDERRGGGDRLIDGNELRKGGLVDRGAN
jgi:hypothetical protein